jgi:hypothetical protein
MAAHAVEGRRLEFRSPPELIEPSRSRLWLGRLSIQLRSSNISRAIGLILGVAAVAIAWLYAKDYAVLLRSGAQPLVRIALAAAIGLSVTVVHKRVRGRTVGYSLARAQTLLCVAGALTMTLIDNSVARAFGIAGAASIVRFRTPVDDPTDATVLFLLMALGMASGVGAVGLSLVGAVAVCLLLLAFGTLAPEPPRRRHVTIDLVAAGHEFPRAHVERIFAAYGVVAEPAEWSQDTATRVRYRAAVDETLSLEDLGADLMSRGEAALQSVAWEIRKNGA